MEPRHVAFIDHMPLRIGSHVREVKVYSSVLKRAHMLCNENGSVEVMACT